jgi:hypothetical protein
MDESLRLTFKNDYDGTGQLQADLSVDGFATRGSAYFNITELQGLAHALLSFPLPEKPRLRIAGGFFSKTEAHALDTVLLSLEFLLWVPAAKSVYEFMVRRRFGKAIVRNRATKQL